MKLATLAVMTKKTTTPTKTVNVEEKAKGKPKVKRFIHRSFDVKGHKLSGETITVGNVGLTVAKRERVRLTKLGFYRVDIIEIGTTVNEKVSGNVVARKMEFARQLFAAANNKWQPNVIVEDKPIGTQATFPWELLSSTQPAWLDTRPIVKVSDRRAKDKVARKRAAIFAKLNAKNNSIETMKIFDRATGNFLFSSVEEEDMIQYIVNNNRTLENIIIYVPTDIYEMLKGME